MASNDHRLDIYVDAVTYMALRARAADLDRNISQHVRHLIRSEMTDGTPGDWPAGSKPVSREQYRSDDRLREALRLIVDTPYYQGTKMQRIAREALGEGS